MTEPLLAVAGLVFVAVISPGPNNFIVMRNAAFHGLRGATVTIASIVAGTFALLLVAASGITFLFHAAPSYRQAIVLIGVGYLCFLGLRLLFVAQRQELQMPSLRKCDLPGSALGLIAFQFLNPKSWVIVMTATSRMASEQNAAASPLTLIPIFIVLSAVCLCIWAVAGFALSEFLKQHLFRRLFDIAMGILLIASGLMLL